MTLIRKDSDVPRASRYSISARVGWGRLLLASVIGSLVAAAILVLRMTGHLGGAAAVVLAALVLLSLPISRNLSRRVLLGGAIILGWIPLAWWFDLGPTADRAGLVLATTCGILAGWLVGGGDIRHRLRKIVPHLHATDGIPLAAAVVSTWLYLPLATTSSDSRTLTLIMKSGWDHVAHFNMVETLGREGSLAASFALSPDGSEWVGARYPKQFHILVESAVQLVRPSAISAGIDLRDYGQGLAFVLVGITILLAAGLAQLPGFTRRPQWAWPLAALPIGAFLFGPGAVSVTAGYPNFVLACATVGLTACVAAGMGRIFMPVHAFATIGLLIATAHGWLLLLPIALVAASVAFVPLRRARWRAPLVSKVLTFLALLAGIAGVGIAVWLVVPDLRGDTLLLGSAEPFPAGSILGSASLAIAIGLVGIGSYRGHSRSESGLRSAVAGLVAVASLVLLFSVAFVQVRSGGDLLYYFGKLASGTLLVSLIVVAMSASTLVGSTPAPVSRRARSIAWTASILLVIAAVQPFGYVGPSFGGLVTEQAPGIRYRSDSVILTGGDSAEGLRLMHASQVVAGRPFGRTLYFASLPGDPTPQLSNQWALALAGQWSLSTEELSDYFKAKSVDTALETGELAPAIEGILLSEPSLDIVVAPETYATVRPELDPGLQNRLITWQ